MAVTALLATAKGQGPIMAGKETGRTRVLAAPRGQAADAVRAWAQRQLAAKQQEPRKRQQQAQQSGGGGSVPDAKRLCA